MISEVKADSCRYVFSLSATSLHEYSESSWSITFGNTSVESLRVCAVSVCTISPFVFCVKLRNTGFANPYNLEWRRSVFEAHDEILTPPLFWRRGKHNKKTFTELENADVLVQPREL